MKAPILATILLTTTLLANTGTSAGAAGPPVSWYRNPVFFCPVRYTTYGQLVRCRTPLLEVGKDDDALLFFPNILARDATGRPYWAGTMKLYGFTPSGKRVALGEQRGLGPLSLPGTGFGGPRHLVYERLSQLMDPIFGVRRVSDERPIRWSCNKTYQFYVATARGQVGGATSIYLRC